MIPQPKGWFCICDVCWRRDGRKVKFFHASPYIVIRDLRNHLETEHDLECAFCYLKFAGFKELAEHVNLAHLAPEERDTNNGTTSTKGESFEEFWNSSRTRGRLWRLRPILERTSNRKIRYSCKVENRWRTRSTRNRLFRRSIAGEFQGKRIFLWTQIRQT